MSDPQVRSVGIIGAGTMGTGIAQVFGMHGFEVKVYDIKQETFQPAKNSIEDNLNKGINKGKITQQQKEEALRNIVYETNIKSIQADLVIEAVVEKLDVKRQIFEVLEQVNNEKTIFATNTSSLPVTQIASGMQSASRLVGFHFFNPAHIMPLVEIISGTDTLPEVAQALAQIARSIGKEPVLVKDSPGFIVNRIARFYYLESLHLLEEGTSEIETIDALLEGVGFKMGPFRLMDLIGVHTNHQVSQSMYQAFFHEERFRPSRIQQQLTDAGHWGKKTGKGFYTYPDPSA